MQSYNKHEFIGKFVFIWNLTINKKIGTMIINSVSINTIDTSLLKIFSVNRKFALLMARRDKIDFIYNTSALEGNAMTYPEVQTLLEGITVGGHKLSDEQQILNQNRSVNLFLEMIKNNEFHLNKETFLKLHSKVAFEEALAWGEFRKSGVNIGGTEYQPPLAGDLDDIFEAGIKELKKIKHPIVRAVTAFLFGAKCQFFYDGNKRTSRLIMNGVLLDSGYPILNIKAKDKLEFNKQMINFYDGKNINSTIKYLLAYYVQKNKNLVLK